MNKLFEELINEPKTVEEIELEFKKMMEDPEFIRIMTETQEDEKNK